MAAIFSAFIIGMAKTGLPGVAILAIPLLAGIFPARESTGFVLPMLVMADLFAIVYYKKTVAWRYLARLVPWTAAGIVIGYQVLGKIEDSQLRPLIGLIILLMLAASRWRATCSSGNALPDHWTIAALIGLLSGTITMLANASGPIMVIYLLAMGLPKQEFIGTGAWYFFFINLLKVPLSWHLGLISSQSLALNTLLLPVIILGAMAGIMILHRMPRDIFIRTVKLLAFAAAIRLLFM